MANYQITWDEGIGKLNPKPLVCMEGPDQNDPAILSLALSDYTLITAVVDGSRNSDGTLVKEE